MAGKPFVLDTSALMTFIEKEEGAERVREVIQKNQIIIPWLALLETVYISQRELGKEEAITRYALLKKLNATIIWNADEILLLSAARIKATYPLSIADSIIAALTSQHEAILLHKDPEYEPLKDIIGMESLPYKK